MSERLSNLQKKIPEHSVKFSAFSSDPFHVHVFPMAIKHVNPPGCRKSPPARPPARESRSSFSPCRRRCPFVVTSFSTPLPFVISLILTHRQREPSFPRRTSISIGLRWVDGRSRAPGVVLAKFPGVPVNGRAITRPTLGGPSQSNFRAIRTCEEFSA